MASKIVKEAIKVGDIVYIDSDDQVKLWNANIPNRLGFFAERDYVKG